MLNERSFNRLQKNELLVKNIFCVDDNIGKDEKEFIELTESIIELKKETLNSVFLRIKNSQNSLKYFINCAKYAILIRPKQKEYICRLIHDIECEETDSLHLDINSIKTQQRNADIFTKQSVEQAIFNDDNISFINFASQPDFNPNDYISENLQIKTDFITDKLLTDNYSYNGKSIKANKKLTYIELMAFLGSVNCFKYAMMDKTFKLPNCIANSAIAGGNNEIIRILEHKGIRFDFCLEIAIKFHRFELCNWLLNNYKCEEITLEKCLSFFNNKFFFFMVKNNVYESKWNLSSSFLLAIKLDNYEVMKYLKEECNVLSLIKDNETPLFTAIERGNLSIFKYLVENCNFKAKTRDSKRRTSLEVAIISNSLEIVKYLIEVCNYIENEKEMQKYFQISCERSRIKIVEYFVEKCNANITDDQINDSEGEIYDYLSNKCLLHRAFMKNDLLTAKQLVESKLYSFDQKYNGKAVLDVVLENCNLDVVKYLVLNINIDINKCNKLVIHNLCKNGKLDLLKFLVEKFKFNPLIKDINERIPLHIAAENGNLDIVRYLITECNSPVDATDKFRRTALSYAAENGNLEVVKFLVENCGANVEFESLDWLHKTALQVATDKCHFGITRFLIEDCKANIKNVSKNSFINATKEGNLDFIKYLTDKCNKELLECNQLFNVACENGNIEIAKYFAKEYKINVEWKNKNGETALLAAKEDLDLIKYLVKECNSDINVKNSKGETVLHSAAKKNKLEIIRFLVEDCKMNIESRDVQGLKPYQVACLFESFDVIKYFVEHCNVNIKDFCSKMLKSAVEDGNKEKIKFLVKNCKVKSFCDNKSALEYSVLNNNLEMTKFLIEECKLETEQEIFIAIKNKNIYLVKYLNEQRINKSYDNIMDFVCLNGDLEAIKYFAEECNQSLDNITNSTFLQLVLDEKLEIAKYLAKNIDTQSILNNFEFKEIVDDAYAKVNVKLIKFLVNYCHAEIKTFESDDDDEKKELNKFFETKYLLHDACESCNLDLIKHLIEEKHFYPNQKFNGDTAFHFAIYNKNIETIKYLVEKCGADVEIKNHEERTALMIAIYKNDFNLAKYFLEKCHANVEAKDGNKRTALFYAIENSNMDIIKYLVEVFNANIEAKSKGKITPLLFACWEGKLEPIKYLVETCNCQLNIADKEYKSPLHIASCINNIELAKYLVNKCPELIELKDIDGKTPLHYSVEKCEMNLTKFFIEECKMSVDEEDYDEQTALSIAINNGSLELIKYLIEECDSKSDALLLAAKESSIEIFKFIAEKCKTNLYAKNSKRKSVLHIAVTYGNFDVVRYLTNYCHIDVENRDNKGKTVLFDAVSTCDLRIVKFLIEKCRANVEEKDNKGRTVLEFALRKSTNEIIMYLIDECNAKIYPKYLKIVEGKWNQSFIDHLTSKIDEVNK